jgi:hypothetical protein
MRKIKFIKSPVGAFNLAYQIGSEAEINEGQANVLVDAGYAVFIGEKEVPEKQIVESPEKPKKSK